MKKLLGIIVIVLLIVVIAGALAWYNAPHVFATIISHKTQVPVSIKDIGFSRESFKIEDLSIANPKGAKLEAALKVETIKVDAPYLNYIKNPIIIDEIHLDHMYVNIEIYNKAQTEGNWHTIIKNVEEDHTSLLSIKRQTIIKKLILTNIDVNLILSDGSQPSVSTISRLEFNNITSEKGIPMQEISEIIIQNLIHSIFLEKGLKAIIEAPIYILEGIFRPFFGSSPTN